MQVCGIGIRCLSGGSSEHIVLAGGSGYAVGVINFNQFLILVWELLLKVVYVW